MWGSPQEKPGDLAVPQLGTFSPRHEARLLFGFLKDAASLETLASRAIPFGRSELPDWERYRLIPLTWADSSRAGAIDLLVRLRIGAEFPGDAEITVDGTARWVNRYVLNIDDRILFWVMAPDGSICGHLGLWFREDSTLELDNVVKNPDETTKGVMTEATKALGRWVYEFLGLGELSLRVFPKNMHAIKFYEHLGFEVQSADSEWQTMSVDLEKWFERPEKILTAGPSIGPLETSFVGEAVRTGWNDHHSDFLASFSAVFGSYEKAQFVIPTDSCTSALHLSLWALGIGPGDEVIVPDITWVATAAAVRYVGATPIFADIDPNTWCITVETVSDKLSARTRAVIPVHLYGYVAEVDKIGDLCDEIGIDMIQDAAPGIGTTLDGESITNWGVSSCFSFQGAKLLVSGEGGALVTRDASVYEKALKISESGRVPGTFWIDELGKKMKMSNSTAALALAQVFGVERQINKKRQIGQWYREFLNENVSVGFQQEISRTRSIHWLTSIQILNEDVNRDKFQKDLLASGIDSRPVFPPISRYPVWDRKQKPNPNASRVGDSSLNLPSGVRLKKVDIERVSETIQKLLASS